MQRRVGPCRRCFVFMHESMPREPLVIVHVALMDKIADNLQDIIKRVQISAEDEEQANTAIYYSISSTQQGNKIFNKNGRSYEILRIILWERYFYFFD
jgi:malonyl-CoA decarboxylase